MGIHVPAIQRRAICASGLAASQHFQRPVAKQCFWVFLCFTKAWCHLSFVLRELLKMILSQRFCRTWWSLGQAKPVRVRCFAKGYPLAPAGKTVKKNNNAIYNFYRAGGRKKERPPR